MIRLWDSLRKAKEGQPCLGSDNASIPVCNILQEELKWEISGKRVEEGRKEQIGTTERDISLSSLSLVVSSTEAVQKPSNSNALSSL